MHDIPADKVERLRKLGFGDQQIEELRSTGATSMTRPGGVVGATIGANGMIAVTSTMTAATSVSTGDPSVVVNAGSAGDALQFLAPEVLDKVQGVMAQAEMNLNTDIDGDGVIGTVSTGSAATPAGETAPPAAERADSHATPAPAAPTFAPASSGSDASTMPSPLSMNNAKAGHGAGLLLAVLLLVIAVFGGGALLLHAR